MTTVTEMKILLVNTLKLSIKTAAGYDVCTGRRTIDFSSFYI